MLKAIADFFERQLGGGGARPRDAHTIELATAALLAEMARVDGEIAPAEREAALRAVREKLGLDPAEADRLFELAEAEARQATDYFQFTSLINRHFDAGQKMRVIELMWRVALADDEIDAHERHLIRRIADLIHVPHADFVHAQRRAREAGDSPGD
ncbi:TerB family tellurite resistance protein [Burkholderiaceae bacterium FT117]|uniref:tellurite resistance TerB family protein n=1 Tax=Zeimonas sediminis TaxID=2944268 RepID=UPI002342DC43|nr:TerB family tellurite resistance protein [Zeimonas sediminis]MCM5571423.1 TerB family tellurite resistance protein [Zeimonas sediminis]